MINPFGFMFFFGCQDAEGSFFFKKIEDELSGDLVVEHLLVEMEDGGCRVAEGDDLMEDVPTSEVGDGLFEVDLIRIEFFDVVFPLS